MENLDTKSLLKLLKLSFQAYKDNFHILLPVALIFYIPLNLALDFTLLRDINISTITSWTEIQPLLSDPLFIANNAISLLSFILVVPIYIVAILTTAKWLKKEKVLFKEIFTSALKYWWAGIIVSILANLVILLGFALFILPGIALAIYLMFSLQSLILVKQKNTAALRYSRSVVKKRWWPIFYFVLSVQIIIFVITGFISSFVPSGFGLTTLTLTIASIISVYSMIFNTLLFVGLKPKTQT